MKPVKPVNFVFLGVWLLQLLAEGAALVCVWQLDMLPLKYFLILTAALILLLLPTGALLFWRIENSNKKKLRRWIACSLIALIVIGCVLACIAVVQLRNTIEQVTDHVPEDVMMSVYVRADDPAQTLADAVDYQFASVLGYEEEMTAQVVAHISQQLGKEMRTVQYESVPDMINALFSKEIGAIILNSAYIEILESVELYEDFAERTKVLYEVPVASEPEPELPTEATQPTESTETETVPTEPVVEKTVANTPFVIYISGSDSRSSKLKTSLNDVNILMVVNPVDKQILLLNTPRDYYVKNPNGKGARDKLTHCGVYGVNCSIKALAGLYDIPVEYYARINFNGFKKLVDAIGGITVYSDQAFTAGNYRFKKGENQLNGAMALAFARNRKNVSGGDNGRGKNQMKLLSAIINKLTTSPALITNYSSIMQSLQGMFATSMGSEDISLLVKMQLEDMASWDILSYAVSGSTGRDYTYSMPGRKLSVMYVNEKQVNHASNLVKRMLAGEVLTSDDLKIK